MCYLLGWIDQAQKMKTKTEHSWTNQLPFKIVYLFSYKKKNPVKPKNPKQVNFMKAEKVRLFYLTTYIFRKTSFYTGYVNSHKSQKVLFLLKT